MESRGKGREGVYIQEDGSVFA